MSNDSPPLLPEATLEQIFTELSSRYQHVALGAVSEGGTQRECLRYMHSGGLVACVGVARSMYAEFLKMVLDSAKTAIGDREDSA